MSRTINIADGFTSASAPSISGGASSLLENYVDDAAFVTANGTAQKGDIYFNTTSNVVRYYNGTSWENIADNDNLTDHINDTSTHGVGVIVGTTESQTLTNKTIDSDNNIITNIVNADIKAGAAIDATKIADGTVTSTEFQYIGGLTSDAQTQINSKASSSDLSTHISDTTTHGTTGDIVGTTDSQSVSNKTLSVINFTDAITCAQISTPSNPASSKNKLYFKSDEKLYKLTSGGVESEVGGGSYTSVLPVVYTTTAGQTLTSGSTTIIDFGTVVYDASSNVTTGASWRWTCTVAAYYKVNSQILINASWSATDALLIAVYKNGSEIYSQYAWAHATATLLLSPNIVTPAISMSATDYFDVRVFQNSGSDKSLTTSALRNFISIEKVA